MRRAPVTLQQAAQPSFTLIEERIAGTTATDVPQGGSAQFYVVLQSNNGYTGTPALSATDLPPGISVTFSNNALETYGVVTATVSASYQATPGLTTLYINGFDGTTWYTLGAQFTVTTPPLTASASLMFSHANSTTHTAQLATIRAATSGGAAPFTYTWSSNGIELSQSPSPVFTTPAPAAAMPITLTVTDSSTPAQSTTISGTLPAAPTLPDALLYYTALMHIAALNDLSTNLASEGLSTAYIQNLAQGSLTSAQYNAVLARAIQHDAATPQTSTRATPARPRRCTYKGSPRRERREARRRLFSRSTRPPRRFRRRT